MNSFKKFEFDNFVVGENEDTPIQADTESVVEELSNVEEAQNIIEEPIIAEPVARVYSEAEMIEAKNIAEQTGFEKGYKTKSDEVEQSSAIVLENINTKLMDIISHREELDKKLEQDFINLNREVIKKLIPTLNEGQAVEILNKFLAENFANFRKASKLSFYFNPAVIKDIQAQVSRLAHIHDFEGKISIHKDEDIGVSDCRIEWENGGVEKNSKVLLEKIDNMLEDDREDKLDTIEQD